MDLENITQKVRQLGRDTVEEVQKMNEIRQLKRKEKAAKKQIETTYAQIGRRFFELNSASAPEGYEEYVQTILGQKELIRQLKEQIRAVKGVALCPSCNMEVPLGERFCSNCGSRMPEPPQPEEEDGNEDEVVAEADASEVSAETETSAEEAEAAEEAPAEEAGAAEEASAEEAEAAEEAPAEEAETAEEAPAEEAEPAEETPAEEAETAEEAPAEETETAEEAPAEETPAEETETAEKETDD